MLKIFSVSLISAAVALAAIPQQANAGGRGVALGVGLGLGAAMLMNSANKSHRASRSRRAAHRRAAARRKSLARKKRSAYAARKAAIAKKRKQARAAAVAAKKRQLAKKAAIARQQQLAREAATRQQKAETLASIIELPGKKPSSKILNVAQADFDEDDYKLDTYSPGEETAQKMDCKRFIPSAGLTISVPCGE